MNAAARIGDDALQKQSQGYVVPESFTHGTSAQRTRWFNNGTAERQRQGLRHLQHEESGIDDPFP
jgi:predicted metalloprotease